MIRRFLDSNMIKDFLNIKCSYSKRKNRIRLKVSAPASIANLGPGFDVLAVAISDLKDVLEISYDPHGSDLDLEVQGIDIPKEENIVYRIASIFQESCEGSLYLKLFKGIPISKGLGSSGASSVAAVVGLSKTYGLDLSDEEIISIAGYGESIVAGEPHYDNVSASYLGGFVLIDHEMNRFIKLDIRKDIWFTILIPEISVPENKTLYARSLLPNNIDRRDVIKQMSNIAKLFIGIYKEDLKMMGEALSKDYIAEPYRSKMIPYYYDLKKIALENGALGFNISGAGPSVFALTKDSFYAERIGRILSKYLSEKGVENRYFTAKINNFGAVAEVIM